jgi:hypothetical protein
MPGRLEPVSTSKILRSPGNRALRVSSPEIRGVVDLVVGTGVDPVTSRFSGARSTN